MFHLNNRSFLLSIWSFALALTLVNAIDSGTMIPSKGFKVLSQVPSVASSLSPKYEIANAGDINNDGYEDIIIGEKTFDSNKGIVYVIYGTASPLGEFDFANGAALNHLTTGFTIKGAVAGDFLGCSVSSAGDVNHDGYVDIIIGAYGKNSMQGAVYVIYGGKKLDLKDLDLSMTTLDPRKTGFMITGNAVGDYFGSSVRTAGDFDKDHYDDIIIGAPFKKIPIQGGSTLFNAGAAYVIYGRPKASSSNIDLSTTNLHPDTTGFMIQGETDYDYLGLSVSSAGDIDGDGFGDIMIAAPNKDSFIIDNGAVYIIYGAKKSSSLQFNPLSTSLNPTSSGFMVTGNAANDRLGSSISAAGDVNGDGFGDIIIGTPYQSSTQGVAYVIYGKNKADMTNIDLFFDDGGYNVAIKYQESTKLESPGSDMIQKDADNNRLLQASLLAPDQGFVIVGESESSLGCSVSSAGDVNGDGYDDVLIGARGNLYKIGKVHVIYGGETRSGLEIANANLPQADLGFSIVGSQVGGSFGSSVGSMTGLADNKKMKLLVTESLQSGQQASSLILFPSKLCSEHCDFCNIEATCSICSGGYWRTTAAGGTCEVCPKGCTQCTDDKTCQACEIGYDLPSANSLCMKSEVAQFYGSSRENATKDAFEGTSIVGAALNSGSSLPINFGLAAKILRNVKYLDVTVSTELQEAFISWKVNSGFLAAPKPWAAKAEAKVLPDVFGRYGLAAAFLVNYWKPFLMTLIGLAVFGLFKGIEIVVYKGDQETLKSSIPRKLNLAASNFALTQVYSNLDDAILYFILDARSTKVDGGFGAFSLILAVVIILVGGMIIGVHIFLLRKYQGIKSLKTDSPPTQLQRFLYKYENLKLIFSDFKDITFFTQSFLWIHVTRALLSSFLFATLFEYPVVQLVFLLMLNLGMIVFLFIKKSFKDLFSTFSQLFCEVILLIANICMLGLAIMDQNESYNLAAMKNLSRAVIVLNAILLIGCAILMVIGVLKSLYESYMVKKKAASEGLKSLPKLQNHRLNSDKSQLGTLSTGNYSVGQYETRNYLKTAGNHDDTLKTGGYHYDAEGGINNQIEVFDLNSNQISMSPVINPMVSNQREAQLELNNASFSYQADDLVNTSNINLLSNNNNNSFVRAESIRRPKRRNIKMPGGVQANPKPSAESPVLIWEFEGPIQDQNGSSPRVGNSNIEEGGGGQFSLQRTRLKRRFGQNS